MATDVQNSEAPPAESGENQVATQDAQAPATRKRASVSPNRAPSTMPGRRGQFAWAAGAVDASSILASTWLQRPTGDEPAEGTEDKRPAKVLALFYFRTPKEGHKKHQVYTVTRKDDGNISFKRLGEGDDAVVTYRDFYSPEIQKLRTARRAEKEKARAGRPKRQRKASPADQATGEAQADPSAEAPQGAAPQEAPA